MNTFVKEITSKVEPIHDSIYGPSYRCSLTLKDGTFLPCAVLQSKARLVALAKRRMKEEMHGKGSIGGPDPYGQIVSSFVAGGNRINDYDVLTATESAYAIPLSLLLQIRGETTMGWTGWVFKMNDSSLFSYGSAFNFEFFQLPEAYTFDDVAEVINQSFVDATGSLASLVQGGSFPVGYDPDLVLRERVFFTCAVDSI